MKLLTISHPCVTPINQQFFAEIEQQTGWEITIVTPSNWKNEYGNQLSTKRWQAYQGKLKTIPVWKSGSIPLHLYRSSFIQLLRQVSPDVIYVHHEPYALATAQIYLANQISINRPIGFYSAQNILKNYPLPFSSMEQAVFARSDFAFPVSQSVESVLRDKGFTGQSTCLPLTVDPAIYYPHPDAQQLKAELQQQPNEVLIGYVGRVVEEKGLGTLLKALSRIQELPWRLVVIGSGSYEAQFDRLAQDLKLSDRITRLGYIPHTEAPRYLSALDTLLLPSETQPNWKEQFGRVIIEALACKTPVLGSDSGEIPHLLRATGGGLVFPERQPEALAERLELLINNPSLRINLAQRGHDVVHNQYTNTAIAGQFIRCVEQSIQTTCSMKKIA